MKTFNNSPADILYNKLSASKNSIRRENAYNIKQVCDQMVSDKIEITISSVAKRCIENYGQPAITTITNTGSELGDYVRLRRNEQQLDKHDIVDRVSISNKISDPVLAQQIKILEETIKLLKNENDAFRKSLRSLKVDSDSAIKALMSGNTQIEKVIEISDSPIKHDPILKKAILSLMEHLAQRGYGLYRGRYGINKKTVLMKNEYDILKEVTGISEKEWTTRIDNQ